MFHELDGKIFAVFDKLPLADLIRKVIHDFYIKVGETRYDLDFDIRIVLYDPYFSA